MLVSGIVQGVGYRAFTERVAKELGLTGWVRNLEDSRVEVWAEGEREVLDRLIERLNEGPRYAEVKNVEARKVAVTNATAFEIKKTATQPSS